MTLDLSYRLSRIIVYLPSFICIGLVIPGYGTALFLPTIIHDLGYSAANAQLLTVPFYVAGAITTILVGMFSGRLRIVIFCAFTAMMGYIVLYTQRSPDVGYFGTVLVYMGLPPCLPIVLAWIGAYTGGEVKRSVAIAMVLGFANLGGICAAFIFFDPPWFHVGLNIIMGCLSMTILLSLVATCGERGLSGDDNREFKELGDDNPLCRYA